MQVLGLGAVFLGPLFAGAASVWALRSAPDRVFAVLAAIVSVLEILGLFVLMATKAAT